METLLLNPAIVIVHVPGDGAATALTVKFEALGAGVASVANAPHAGGTVATSELPYEEPVQPACDAVKLNVEPVPLAAYKSISGFPETVGPEYTTGASDGANVTLAVVAFGALADTVVGLIAKPLYVSVTSCTPDVIVTDVLGVDPFTDSVTALLPDVRVTGFAYTPGMS